MNCDQTFDVLTRGPFPTGDPLIDQRVELHLRRCSACRELADALRPAIALFHETLDHEADDTLPRYRQELPWEGLDLSVAPVVSPRRLLTPRVRVGQRGRRVRARAGWGLLSAAALLLITVGMFEGMPGRQPRESRAPRGESSAAEQASAPTMRAVQLKADNALVGQPWLPALSLLSSCVPAGDGPLGKLAAAQPPLLLAAADLDALRCCTECHHAGMAAIRRGSMHANAVASNCQVCH